MNIFTDGVFNSIVLSNISDGVVVAKEGKILFANREILDLFSLSIEEVKKKTIAELFNEKNAKKLELLEEKEQRLFSFSNAERSVNYYMVHVDSHQDHRIYFLKNVNDKFSNNLELTKLENRYYKIHNKIKCAVFQLEFYLGSSSLIVKDLNHSAEINFCIENREEVVGQEFFQVIGGFSDLDLRDSFQKTYESKEDTLLGVVKYEGCGEKFLESRVFYIDEETLGFLALDVTEHVLLKEQYKDEVNSEIQKSLAIELESLESAKLDSLNQMVQLLAHHWRQPLNVISLATYDIIDSFDFNELTKEKLDKDVHLINTHLGNLSSTLDDFSRFTKTDPRNSSFDIIKAIKNIEEKSYFRLEEEDITFKVDTVGFTSVENCVTVKGDLNIFSQGFLKIIDNAVEAIHRKKELSKKGGRIIVNVMDKISSVEITVKNNGEVLERELFKDIYKPYFSTKEELNYKGLGLFFVKSVIETMMGGKIYCEHNPNGSTFVIVLRKL